ncbi:hypothetical protein [Bifidobacterium scaligerum]|uniref:Uncharacterized protein n=1 Tax=Bifidobacterium scaligerum TaxID=2052656 RepID=A0A2M9HT72_9BIFI|nr:hypothetical protein [Bifidobacterium scaligerum]PJM80012.1 hypothetical protein CUU80_02440 [Bifidobacterium scaligerum]
MRELDEYEETLCPLCGLPESYCHSDERWQDLTGTVESCRVTKIREQTMKQFADKGRVDYPDAMLVRIQPKKTEEQ